MQKWGIASNEPIVNASPIASSINLVAQVACEHCTRSINVSFCAFSSTSHKSHRTFRTLYVWERARARTQFQTLKLVFYGASFIGCKQIASTAHIWFSACSFFIFSTPCVVFFFSLLFSVPHNRDTSHHIIACYRLCTHTAWKAAQPTTECVRSENGKDMWYAPYLLIVGHMQAIVDSSVFVCVCVFLIGLKWWGRSGANNNLISVANGTEQQLCAW